MTRDWRDFLRKELWTGRNRLKPSATRTAVPGGQTALDAGDAPVRGSTSQPPTRRTRLPKVIQLGTPEDLATLIARDGLQLRGLAEKYGPCPGCGGRDRFHWQPARGRWFCRQCHPRWGDAEEYRRHFSVGQTALPAYPTSTLPKPSRTYSDAPDRPLPSTVPQKAPGGTSGQVAPSDRDAQDRLQAEAELAQVRERIAGRLAMATDPVVRALLVQLQQDTGAADAVQQALDAIDGVSSPLDAVTRLAEAQWQWALAATAADTLGKRLTRGDTLDRERVIRRIEVYFHQEPDAVLRLRLAQLARLAVTDPLGARNQTNGYQYGRTAPDWVAAITKRMLGGQDAVHHWQACQMDVCRQLTPGGQATV